MYVNIWIRNGIIICSVWNVIITRVPDGTTDMMLYLEIKKLTYYILHITHARSVLER